MLNSLFRFRNTFEVHKPVIVNEQVTWVKDRDEKGLVVPGMIGLVALVTKTPLEIGDSVFNLTDVSGVQLFVRGGQPYRVYVTDSTPQIDPDGYLIGWRHSLARELPRKFEEEILRLFSESLES